VTLVEAVQATLSEWDNLDNWNALRQEGTMRELREALKQETDHENTYRTTTRFHRDD